MTTTDITEGLPADQFQADYETRDANARKFARSNTAAEPCFFCGRPLTEQAVANGWMVHMTEGGMLVPRDWNPNGDWSGSQGAFPVGSECAKKIARPFKFKR